MTAPFAQVFDPGGVATDSSGNVYISYVVNGLLNASTVVGKFSSSGQPIGVATVAKGLVEYPGQLTPAPSGGMYDLLPDGSLYVLSSNGAVSPLLNLHNLSPDTSSVYDIQTGKTANFGGRIFPSLQGTLYGDIATYGNDILVTGYAPVNYDPYTGGPGFSDYLFVERLQISSTSVTAKVLVSSSATPDGEGNGSGSTSPRGVAVNSKGMVLTTLPIAPKGVLTLNYDVPVAFGINFPEGNGPAPYLPFDPRAQVSSRGMTADSSGNFLIATGPIGSVLNGTGYGYVVVNSSLDGIGSVPLSSNSLNSAWDVAAAPGGGTAYLASQTSNLVISSSYGIPSPIPTPSPTPGPTPSPTPGPTPSPTPSPTPGPTPAPTPGPTPAPTPGPTPAPTPTVAPVLTGEMPTFSGRGRRRTLASARILFSGALDFASAQNLGSYRVLQHINRRKTVSVAVQAATYNPADHSVTLLLGKSKKGKPLELTVSGLRGSNGVPLAPEVINL